MKKVKLIVEKSDGSEFMFEFLTADEDPVDAVFSEFDLDKVKAKECQVETLEVRAVGIGSYKISPKD